MDKDNGLWTLVIVNGCWREVAVRCPRVWPLYATDVSAAGHTARGSHAARVASRTGNSAAHAGSVPAAARTDPEGARWDRHVCVGALPTPRRARRPSRSLRWARPGPVTVGSSRRR